MALRRIVKLELQVPPVITEGEFNQYRAEARAKKFKQMAERVINSEVVREMLLECWHSRQTPWEQGMSKYHDGGAP